MKTILLVVGMMFVSVSLVSAHVVVKPAQVGVGMYQTFTVGVPVEKDIPTVGLRLVIPEGVQSVTPNVKPGWKINVIKSGTGESAKVTEVVWTGGVIPAGQRDEFNFSAKVPSTETSVAWKAYQTYSNGEVVAWDDTPVNTTEEVTPFSVTKVVNDLTTTSTTDSDHNHMSRTFPYDRTFTIFALVFSLIALGLSLKRKI